MKQRHRSSDELHTHAYAYALAWCRQQHIGPVRELALLPCTSSQFLAQDRAWIVRPTLHADTETEPFLLAWRNGQFAAMMLQDFILSIASQMESSWHQRGYPEAVFVCDWHPSIDELSLPDLQQVHEQDDLWVLEIATSLDFSATSPVPAIFSVVWLHYRDHPQPGAEIKIINTIENPFMQNQQQIED